MAITALIVGGLLLLIIFLSYELMGGLARLNPNRYWLFRLLLFPGVVTHELAHLLACWLTNTPVVEVNFWTTTGGHVVHHKPRWPLIQPIISFAPFLSGIVLILILSQLLHGPWWQIALVAYGILIVAATLAPSRADVLPAIEGLLLLAVLIGAAIWLVPSVVTRLEPLFLTLQQQLTIVTLCMALWWLALLVIKQLRPR